MDNRRVVVTGVGVISPLGLDVEQTWHALIAGRSGVRTITAFDAQGRTCASRPRSRASTRRLFSGAGGPPPGPRRPVGPGGDQGGDRSLQARCRHRARTHRRRLRLGHRWHPDAGGRHPRPDQPGSGVGQPVRRAHDDPQHGGGRDRHGVAAPGLQLLHGHRLFGFGPCHRHGLRRHPPGPGRRHGLRGQRGGGHPGRHRRFCGHEGPVHPQRRARARLAALRRPARRLRTGRGGGHPGDRGARVRPPAGRACPGRAGRLWRHRRRLPHHPAPPDG